MATSAVLEFAAKKVATKVLGWPFTVVALVYTANEGYRKEVRDDICRRLHCEHIQLVPMGGPPTIELIEAVHAHQGCGFFYRGIPLYHGLANFDVEGIATPVYRYDKRTRLVGIYSFPPQKCPICSGKQ